MSISLNEFYQFLESRIPGNKSNLQYFVNGPEHFISWIEVTSISCAIYFSPAFYDDAGNRCQSLPDLNLLQVLSGLLHISCCCGPQQMYLSFYTGPRDNPISVNFHSIHQYFSGDLLLNFYSPSPSKEE